jgi:ribosomal protein S18 acetylase RimI-like enzyme
MARPTLTDRSPDGLRAAIEADIVATRLYNQDIPLEAHEEPDVAWSVPAQGSEMRPIAAWSNFAADTVERRLDDLIAVADARGAAFLWWLAPHHGPPDLGDRLARRGFAEVDNTAAMAIDLEDLQEEDEPPSGVRIELLDDADDIDTYVALLMREMEHSHGASPPSARAIRRQHLLDRLGNDPDSRRFIAWLDDRPVATSRLSMAGGAAGLYTVVTMPEARGRGIGRAMTLRAMHAGREAGMRIGTLQATDMGFRIYSKLGFEELFRYRMMVRPARSR